MVAVKGFCILFEGADDVSIAESRSKCHCCWVVHIWFL